ncbi:hypothetical protein GO491_10525 [Flavobacteriaceae bacterium Ap0902]|nr:hypothetical protein [Flavobacteriaceae bacterium Ap0902]
MKKKFTVLMLAVFSLGTVTAQVGVETDTPTEMLDVSGTVRIQDLPISGQGTIYTKPDGTRSSSKDQQFNAKSSLMVDENGVIGLPEGKTPTFVEACSAPGSDFTQTNNNFGTTVSLGDWEFEWWRSGYPTPWTADGNYFRLRNTAQSYHFNSWAVDGSSYADLAEQDRDFIAQNTWTRFTYNLNNTFAGKKLMREYIITYDGDRFLVTGVLYRKTSQPAKEVVCLNVQKLF